SRPTVVPALLVDVADDEEDRAEDRDEVGHQGAREDRREHADVREARGSHLQSVRLLLAVADHVVALDAERVLGADVDLASGILIALLSRPLVRNGPGGSRS